MFPKNRLNPFTLPIYSFASAIALGTVLLHADFSLAQGPISWVDAFFTAVSATCVTGLVVVDTGTFFSPTGQTIILALIQLGGLGIMTYASLIFYLWRRKISLADRVAVGQSLLHDPRFRLGRFLKQMVLVCLLLEAVGAVLLFWADSRGFSPFSALFHSISAFCNAGFSLQSSSLMQWEKHWGVNFIFMFLIILGGLGFSVLLELYGVVFTRKKKGLPAKPLSRKLTWHARIVLRTSVFLILLGAGVILVAEYLLHTGKFSFSETFLSPLFQSVTCRTAGFNTMDIGRMTNISLLFMIFLMFVGGSPGSCAGGIKTTTFRTLTAFCVSKIKGRRQSVAGRFALDEDTLNRALTLTVFAAVIVACAILLLNITELGAIPHDRTRGFFLEIVFEVFSAFGTVGLSTGLTPQLTPYGKIIVAVVMFVGRLGPVLFLSVLQSFQRKEKFSWPEDTLLIG